MQIVSREWRYRSFAKIVEAVGVIFRSLSSERSRPPPARHCGRSIPRALSGPVDYNVGNLLRRAKLSRPAKRSTSATVSSPPPEWKESVAAAQPTLPADLEGLAFLARRGPFVSAQGAHPASGRERSASPAGACGWSIAILHSVSQRTVRVIFPYEQGDRTTVRRTRSASVRRSRNRKMSARGRFVFSLCPYQTAHSARATPTPRADRRRAHPLRRCKRRVYSRMGPRSSGFAGDSSHQ